MAILDRSKRPYIEDNDELIFIGIDLPFHKSNGSEGYFKSTTTTLDAVKQNIRLLMNTKRGERFMQPNLGLGLERFLFQPIKENTTIEIQDEIIETFKFWLPFVVIQNIEVKFKELQDNNVITIEIFFNLNKDPNTLESVQVTLGE
tara:strand:- start:995 stop:1432 length:438 start_codon:yes stop_codon:yes gene_type:complete